MPLNPVHFAGLAHRGQVRAVSRAPAAWRYRVLLTAAAGPEGDAGSLRRAARQRRPHGISPNVAACNAALAVLRTLERGGFAA
ncbi:MAG TPA: hypothetical protein VGI74_08310 [Streptosporangiaceae bacterium]